MPVITISRHFGSGGKEVARKICERLGYSYFDKNLMIRVAAEVGISEKEVVDLSVDTYKMRGFLERLFGRRRSGAFGGVGTLGVDDLRVESLDEAASINLVKDTIIAAHERDNVVIVGRGGQAVLRDKPGVLHVRITAPRGARAMRVKERDNLTLSQATELVYTRDKAAADYLQHFFSIDWENPLLYHFIINTGWWELEDASELIINALAHLNTGRTD
ncbi:MAG: cytidylate kinase-like family protein [Anaerolineae bacterium]|nr:cytidylate kinase-like family protein [Anaerolineae bacterium]